MGDWVMLSIKAQAPGPRYVVDPEDGEPFTADSIKIAENHVGFKKEAEIECQDYAVDRDEDGYGMLLIGGADPWSIESDDSVVGEVSEEDG